MSRPASHVGIGDECVDAKIAARVACQMLETGEADGAHDGAKGVQRIGGGQETGGGAESEHARMVGGSSDLCVTTALRVT